MLFNRPDQQFHVIAFDANGRVSGQAANITATLSIDGGAYAALNDTNPTEIGTTGEYVFDLTQAETNGYALSFVPVVATAGVEILGMPSNVIYTLTQQGVEALLTGGNVLQVPSPNVGGNLVLTQGDTYNGIGNPKATWNVGTDYTDGWAVMLTIRDKDDAIIYQQAGVVVNATTVTVDIATPTGLAMAGCPGWWQGKFDVELSKGAVPNRSVKTIASGKVYINEDQTR